MKKHKQETLSEYIKDMGFWNGFFGLFNQRNQLKRLEAIISKSYEQNLREDWQAVGNDLKTAIGNYEKQNHVKK